MQNSWDAVSQNRPFFKKKQKAKRQRFIREGEEKKRAKRQMTTAFYDSKEWKKVRYLALKIHGARCQCCGATRKNGRQIHVDHIKPRYRFPALALDVTNLQVLCDMCNEGKGSLDQTDWRGE